MNTSLNIQEFIKQADEFPVIDVRSPGEFEQGHIPGANNVSLFDNKERAKVGTAYKQIGREEAIKIGYELAEPKIKLFINQVERISELSSTNKKLKTVLVHCWRGGLRSSKFAQLLNEHGYTTYTLVKGYKAYRNLVLESFNGHANILVIGGETGSGKTEILKKISESGEQVIDLEAIAHHKGSAFGSLGEKPQPTYEQFENNLSFSLSKLDFSRRIWMEDESRNIGRTQIPLAFWKRMKQAPIFRLVLPKKLRIDRLVNDYGGFSKEELKECILKIHQRLGGQHVKYVLEELEKGNLHEVANTALTYYDRAYNHAHEARSMKDVFFVECETANASINAAKLIECANKKKYV